MQQLFSAATPHLAWSAAILVIAAGLSAIFIHISRPLLMRHALARPNARSSHQAPTPQGGGIAVIASTMIVLCGAGVVFPSISSGLVAAAPILAATLMLAFVGFVDDMRGLGAGPRLALQTAAALIMITTLPADARLAPFAPLILERAILTVLIVGCVNFVNFMDGIDWMSVAEFVPLTLGLALIGLLGALPPIGMVTALALCGAMIGFAPHNRPVARLFLGDVGSLPLGFLLAWLLLLLALAGHSAAAIILPLYYVADATLTLLRRLVRRERILDAHRTHYYQRAGANGWRVIEIVTRVAALNVILVFLAIATIVWPRTAVILGALAAASFVVALLLFSFARGRPPASAPQAPDRRR